MPAGLDDLLFRLGWFFMGIVAAAVTAYVFGWLDASALLELSG